MNNYKPTSLNKLKCLYNQKKNLFNATIKKFDSSNGDRGIVYDSLTDNLKNFLEFSEWLLELLDKNPPKAPVALRICLENFIEINYLLSHLFQDYSTLNRNINEICIKKILKTLKLCEKYTDAGIIGDKTNGFKNDTYIKTRTKEGYYSMLEFANKINIDISKYSDFEKVKPKNLEDNYMTKIKNASLEKPEYWENVYSFLSQYVHFNRSFTGILPKEHIPPLCIIWHKQMLTLLATGLEKSDL